MEVSGFCQIEMSGSRYGALIVVGGNLDRSAARVFDPATNTWTLREPMPESREYITCAAVGSSVFVFGGRANQEVIATVLEYGPG